VAAFLDNFYAQIVATSGLEWTAVIFALGYVYLAAKQSLWCWLCAFLSTAIYTWLFWQVTLPFQALLNFFYMVMAAYGYYQWTHGAKGGETASVITLPKKVHALLVPSLLLCAFGLSKLAASQFNSDHLLLDACIQMLSITTTFMVAHKVMENWVYWFFINLASAYLYFQVGMALSSCLFLGYVGFSVYGFLQWRAQWLGYDESKQHHSSSKEYT